MPNSAASLRSKLPVWTPILALALLGVLSWTALSHTASKGWTLWYGDAEAHLNIARRLADAREPGYEQIGTVWLPLPHLLMAPLVKQDNLWRSGMGGTLPVAACFVLGGWMLMMAARRFFSSEAAGWAALAVWALNPNLLYLQSAPMTEPVALACFAGLLWALSHLDGERPAVASAAAGGFTLLGTLTRYEFWFLIPVAGVCVLLVSKQRIRNALVFGTIASLGPLYWLVHNAVLFSNPLEFYNGYWSAKAIYQRAREGGMAAYPGDHDWGAAAAYYWAAVRLCLGWPAAILGGLGLAGALMRRAWIPAVLCLALPAFYVMSLYSSGTPIFVPHLWPNSYYNTRYGIAALPLAAIGAAALVALAAGLLSGRKAWKRAAPALSTVSVALIGVVCLMPWILNPSEEAVVCWKESQVNSEGRRQWSEEASAYLSSRYRTGDGIFTSFGDLSGVLRRAGIPLREAFHEVERPPWLAAAARPEVFLKEEWAIAFSGDKVSRAMNRMRRGPRRYECVRMYAAKGSPVVEIWRHVQ